MIFNKSLLAIENIQNEKYSMIMEDKHIAAVDLGTSAIRLCVAKVLGDDVQILFYKEGKSDGIRYSSIFNPKKASLALKELINEAELSLNMTIHQVIVGLPKYYVSEKNATGCIEREDGNEPITEKDIDRLKSTAFDAYQEKLENEEKEGLRTIIYSSIAQSFSTEDNFQLLESDIIGMPGDKLEGRFNFYLGEKRPVANINWVFNQLNIDIASKYFTPRILGNVVLKQEELDNGVALVDIGAGSTSVAVYSNNILRHYASIPFGSKNITMDIKIETGITESLADNIKKGFGACMPEKLYSENEKVIEVTDTNPAVRIPIKYLSEIISCRMKEIIDAMLYEIQKSGYADKLNSGIVITGGGANLLNCANYFKDISGYNIRKGYPRECYSSQGCSGTKETEAASIMSMLMAAKSHKITNCCSLKSNIPSDCEQDESGGIEDEQNDYEAKSAKKKHKPYMTIKDKEIAEAKAKADAIKAKADAMKAKAEEAIRQAELAQAKAEEEVMNKMKAEVEEELKNTTAENEDVVKARVADKLAMIKKETEKNTQTEEPAQKATLAQKLGAQKEASTPQSKQEEEMKPEPKPERVEKEEKISPEKKATPVEKIPTKEKISTEEKVTPKEKATQQSTKTKDSKFKKLVSWFSNSYDDLKNEEV